MKVHKLAAIPALVTIAGLSLAACSGQPAPAAKAAATHKVATKVATPVATTPAAAASPVGTWNVAYSAALASILGQYSITQPTAGTYTMTTETALRLPDGNCSVPINTTEGTFTATGPTTYSGTAKTWEPDTCAYAYMSSFTLTFSGGNELTMHFANAEPTSFTLTRAGSSTPSSSPTAAPVASTPAASAAGCIVPNVIGAGSNGHIAASAAEIKVANSCPPIGYHVVTVLTVSGPAGTPAGELWQEKPSAGSSEPPGSTVMLYFQP